MLKAVIFDFDGVIVDSEPCHFMAFKKLFDLLGIEISKERYYQDYLGYTDIELFEAVAEEFKTDFGGRSIEQMAEQKTEIFQAEVNKGGCLIDGVEKFIAELKKNDIRIAICSGAIASDIEVMLAGTSIADAFEFAITADDVQRGKPAPQGYLLALDRLGLSAAECLVIEDSHWGIMAAKSAGIKVLAVTNSYCSTELTGADMVVACLGQLTVKQLCDKLF